MVGPRGAHQERGRSLRRRSFRGRTIRLYDSLEGRALARHRLVASGRRRDSRGGERRPGADAAGRECAGGASAGGADCVYRQQSGGAEDFEDGRRNAGGAAAATGDHRWMGRADRAAPDRRHGRPLHGRYRPHAPDAAELERGIRKTGRRQAKAGRGNQGGQAGRAQTGRASRASGARPRTRSAISIVTRSKRWSSGASSPA